MSFEMEMPESVDTGNSFLSEPGTYHLAVLSVDESPTARNGSLIDGFRVEAEVLDGTTPGQSKKQVEIMFFNPKLTDKNGGEMAKKKQARFAIAVGLIGGPKAAGEKVSVELSDAVGRQFIATLAQDDSDSNAGKKFLRLHFADIWHVDDPDAAAFPTDKKALALLPAKLRRSSDSFAKPGAASGSTSGHSAAPAKQSQPPKREAVGAGAGASNGSANSALADLDDL